MNRRFRLLGSLVALLALFAYFAQGVQAAACGPTMSAETHASSHDTHGDHGKRYRYARRLTLDLLGRNDLLIEDAVADAFPGDLLLALEGNPAPALPGAWQAGGIERRVLAPADAQDCPLGMLMSGTCSIAFLPAPLALVTTDVPQEILLLAAPADAHDLIIAAPLFHPPRA